MPIDADFIRRIYRTSLAVWAFVALMVYTRWGWTAVLGLGVGTAIALGSLRGLEWAVRNVITPGANAAAARRVVVLGLIKMIGIGVLLAGVIVAGQKLQANMLVLLLSLAGGFLLVHVVILLKAAGLWLLGQGVAVTPKHGTPSSLSSRSAKSPLSAT